MREESLEMSVFIFTFAPTNRTKMKRYTDLFVDFDDTLYDTHGNAVIALRELFEAMHLERYFQQPELFYDEYWKTNIDLWTRYSKGEITRDYLIVERFRRPLSTGRGLVPDKAFCLEASDRFLDFCSSKPGLVDGARELTDYLLAQGYRLHLCSNGFHEIQYKKLRACGLDRCFHSVILSEDAGYNKPAPQFFDYALRVSGAKREHTLMIGDNLQTDILGAKQAGLDTAYFNRFPDYPAPEPVTYEVISLQQLMDIL
jgi:putative hydrolase of the HAD superfamily